MPRSNKLRCELCWSLLCQINFMCRRAPLCPDTIFWLILTKTPPNNMRIISPSIWPKTVTVLIFYCPFHFLPKLCNQTYYITDIIKGVWGRGKREEDKGKTKDTFDLHPFSEMLDWEWNGVVRNTWGAEYIRGKKCFISRAFTTKGLIKHCYDQ